MSEQINTEQRQNQAAKTYVIMGAIATALAAILCATVWSDVSSALVFGFLAIVLVFMLVTIFPKK